jgi:hypothetical protein
MAIAMKTEMTARLNTESQDFTFRLRKHTERKRRYISRMNIAMQFPMFPLCTWKPLGSIPDDGMALLINASTSATNLSTKVEVCVNYGRHVSVV